MKLLQAFISFFFKEPKKKKEVKATPGKRKRGGQSAPVVEPVEPVEEEDPVVADVEVDEEGVMDEGKAEFDAATIKSVRGQAIAQAESEWALHMTPKEETDALMLFPKVSIFLCHLRPQSDVDSGRRSGSPRS